MLAGLNQLSAHIGDDKRKHEPSQGRFLKVVQMLFEGCLKVLLGRPLKGLEKTVQRLLKGLKRASKGLQKTFRRSFKGRCKEKFDRGEIPSELTVVKGKSKPWLGRYYLALYRYLGYEMGQARYEVSHQFPSGNQAGNHSHQKVGFKIFLAVFLL